MKADMKAACGGYACGLVLRTRPLNPLFVFLNRAPFENIYADRGVGHEY